MYMLFMTRFGNRNETWNNKTNEHQSYAQIKEFAENVLSFDVEKLWIVTIEQTEILMEFFIESRFF